MAGCEEPTVTVVSHGIRWTVPAGQERAVWEQGEWADIDVRALVPVGVGRQTALVHGGEILGALSTTDGGPRSRAASARIDLTDMGPRIRMSVNSRNPGESCCYERPVLIASNSATRGTVTRLHRAGAIGAFDFPNLLEQYPSVPATSLPADTFGIEMADVLRPVCVLIAGGRVFGLFANADGACRGWDKLTNVDDLQTPRHAVLDLPMLFRYGNPLTAGAFSKPAGLDPLQQAVATAGLETVSALRALGM